MEPPPDKRRKTDEINPAPSGVDDLWVDDDSDNIDALILSQAICQNNNKTSAGKSSTTIYPAPGVVGMDTAKSRSSNDALVSKYSVIQQPIGTIPCQTMELHTENTSKQEGGMGTFVRYSTSVSSAISSISTSRPSLINAELEHLKAENDHLQKQMTKTQLINQGRIKILQDSLAQRDVDIQRLKQEKFEQISHLSKEQGDKEKSMQQDIQKLQSELKFLQKDLQDEIEKQKGTVHHNHPAAVCKVEVIPKTAYDFSEDFQPSQMVAMSKPKSDGPAGHSEIQNITVAVSTMTEPGPVFSVPKMRLKLKNPRGNISGSNLVCKLIQIQLPTHQGFPPITNENSSNNETGSFDTLSSSDSSGVGNACAKLYQANIIVTRTITSLLEGLPAQYGATDLLQSDTEPAIHLLSSIEDNMDSYISVLDSIQTSSSSPHGGYSSISDSAPSLDTLTISGWSLPKGISARYISLLEQQVYKLIQVLKSLVAYSLPVCKLLLGGDTFKQNTNGETQVETCGKSETRTTNHCVILQKLCHLANPKMYHNCSSSLDVCVQSLEILTALIERCSLHYLERLFNELPLSEVILACISEDIDNVEDRCSLGCSVLRLVHTVARSQKAVCVMCSKNDNCILDNVYHFCVQSLTDQPQSMSVLHQAKLMQIVSRILTHGRSSYDVLTTVDCHCGEVVKHLVSILHFIYIRRWYLESSLALIILHQGASLLQNLAAYDKDFTQRHENNSQYVEFVYAMDHIYKTHLQGEEPAILELLMDLRHDLSGEEEDMDIPSPVREINSTSRFPGIGPADLLSSGNRSINYKPDSDQHSVPKQVTALS